MAEHLCREFFLQSGGRFGIGKEITHQLWHLYGCIFFARKYLPHSLTLSAPKLGQAVTTILWHSIGFFGGINVLEMCCNSSPLSMFPKEITWMRNSLVLWGWQRTGLHIQSYLKILSHIGFNSCFLPSQLCSHLLVQKDCQGVVFGPNQG